MNMRCVSGALLAACVLLPPALAEEPAREAAATSNPAPIRISLALAQGFSFLDGGYADSSAYYSNYWETAQTWSIRPSVDLLPVLRIGIVLGVEEYRSRSNLVDDLNAGHARISAALMAPLSLPARFWTTPSAVSAVRGTVAHLRLEAGLGVVDPTSDTYGRLYERTFTYSISVVVGFEYRIEEMGFFLEGGFDLSGAPNPSSGFTAVPDPILSFPVAAGIRIYFS